jgi:hypothetical protein
MYYYPPQGLGAARQMTSCVKPSLEASGAGRRQLPKQGGPRRPIGAPPQRPFTAPNFRRRLFRSRLRRARTRGLGRVGRVGPARHCLMPAAGGRWQVGSLAGWQSAAGPGSCQRVPGRAMIPWGGAPFGNWLGARAPCNPFLRWRIWQKMTDSHGVRASGRIWDNVPDSPSAQARASQQRPRWRGWGAEAQRPRGCGCPCLRGNGNPLRRREPYRARRLATSRYTTSDLCLRHRAAFGRNQTDIASCQLQTAHRRRQSSRAGADLAALGSPVPARAGAERRQAGAPHPARSGANQADRHRLWGDAGPVGAWRAKSPALAAPSPYVANGNVTRWGRRKDGRAKDLRGVESFAK